MIKDAGEEGTKVTVYGNNDDPTDKVTQFGHASRTALRWTLTGFAMLMLAYVGYQFVLEVLLKRDR